MVSVRPVAPARFEQLYPLLHWHDPALDKSAWQRIFDYAWTHDNAHCGYGLFEGDEAVGFIGFLFCNRLLPNAAKPAKFCNLTTWVVKPPFRGHSLSLMMPVMRMKDCTITDLSASDRVVEVSKRLGFKVLDTAVKILLPEGLPVRATDSTVKTPARQTPAVKIFTGEEIARLPLPPVEQTIFNDHRQYPNCHQLVLQPQTQSNNPSQNSYCHVVYTLNREIELSYSHIQYISHLALFEQHQMAIRQHIIRQSQLPLIAIDSRLVTALKLPFSYRLPLSTPRIYRPAEDPRQPTLAQIDNLYSELVLLEFGTADALALGWREKALSICSPALEKLARCG